MWEKVFTASLIAYAVSSGILVLGHYFLPEGSPVTLTGAMLMVISGFSMGASGIGMVLALILRIKARR